ncbi:hypothetical protein ACFFU2_11355 [Halomonas alkalicola]|uniref:hypothetical protein n=1 Tax=Halomonas alkalicola TaxID=1930622 RepID=UPI0035EC96C1
MKQFSQFADIIENMQPLGSNDHLPESLRLTRIGNIETYYAPFEYINREARITICGITPGLQQARNAINAARQCLRDKLPHQEVLAQAKQTASFSGPMRSNLVTMLNYLGIPSWLGIHDSEQLFGSHSHLVHYTSALRYPVLVNGKNYNGTPAMLKQSTLREQIETSLLEEIRILPDNLFLPLGPRVSEVFQLFVNQGVLSQDQVLVGMPHPSGANAERIAYFLERKPREVLSNKVNPDTIDRARVALLAKMSALSETA